MGNKVSGKGAKAAAATSHLMKAASYACDKLTYKPLLFGYSNARVHAMRSAILSRRQIDDLLGVRTAAAVEEYLNRCGFSEDFSNLPSDMPSEERVEIATGRNFARVARKIISFTPPQGRGALLSMLGKYDVHNLRAILMARKLSKGKEETKRLLIPAGSILPEQLERLVFAKDEAEVYSAIAASEFGAKFLSSLPLHHPARRKRGKGQQDISPEALDSLCSELDFYYYRAALAAAGYGGRDADLMRGLLRSEADAKNIMSILRLKQEGVEKGKMAKCMVDGGRFGKEQLLSMAGAKGVSDVVRQASSFFISQTGKGEFSSAEQKYLSDGQLSHFEVVFQNSIARRSLHALRRSSMSLGAIAGFLFLKEEEMKNIRKIVRGKSFGLPNERISEMLVLVG